MSDLPTADWISVSSVITATATVALAIYAYKSFRCVREQMDLLNKQSLTMKRQADIMDEQSGLMQQTLEYERLTRKHERLNTKIRELLGPLIAKKGDYLVFESAGDYGSGSPYSKEHKIFWENIKEKMYLADDDLYGKLQNYFSAMEKYKGSGFVDGYGTRPDEAKEHLINEKEILIQQIELSYKKLQDEIHETELELKMLRK